MIQQNVLPFKVVITKDTITPHAGLALLGEFTMALDYWTQQIDILLSLTALPIKLRL